VHADEIVVLEDGIAREHGTHTALLQMGGRYAALWHAQHASLPELQEALPGTRVVG
jgi:ATP-binding cassette, subfamily B, heavy metal transporter